MNSQENSYGSIPLGGSSRVRRLRALTRTEKEGSESSQKKVVGYTRVSTEEQVLRGYGLEAQERAIRTFAESQDYELIEIIKDPKVSGAKRPEDRPGFKRVLELAKAEAFSVLLVWKFDRLARNLVYSVVTVNDLRERFHVVLRSVTEPIDTSSSMGQMLFAILAGFAEEERRVITRRTISGKKEKARRGRFSGGAIPFGYRKGPTGELSIEPPEGHVVRRIFGLRDGGMSYRDIAETLNNESIASKRGGKWYPATVRYLFDNPKYKGLIEYFFQYDGEQHVLIEAEHEPIIPLPIAA
jgi:site-specific DNA recombinase